MEKFEMTYLVAFEGTADPACGLAWGSGAVEKDGRLINPTTGLSVPADRLAGLADNGNLVRLPVRIEIPDELLNHQIIVCRISRTWIRNFLGTLIEEAPHRHEENGGACVLVFKSLADFTFSARKVIDELAAIIADNSFSRSIWNLMGLAFTLDCNYASDKLGNARKLRRTNEAR